MLLNFESSCCIGAFHLTQLKDPQADLCIEPQLRFQVTFHGQQQLLWTIQRKHFRAGRHPIHNSFEHSYRICSHPFTVTMALNQSQTQLADDTAGLSSVTGNLTPPTRLLHMYHTRSCASIVDSDKKTPLYRVQAGKGGLFNSEPHIIVFATGTNALVGTIRYHSMSGSIDITTYNRSVRLKKSSHFSSAHEFLSQGGQNVLKWRKDGMISHGNMLCLDKSKQVVSRYRRSRWARKKYGKFELSPQVKGILMDEIVVSGSAMVWYRLRKQRSAASAGNASAACTSYG